MQLYNTLSAKERANLIDQAGEERLTLSFYKYAQIENSKLFRDYLFIHWDKLNVLGRIYVAKEGINAQLSVPATRFDEFKATLDNISFLENVRLNIAVEQHNKSFLKLKIAAIKSKSVTRPATAPRRRFKNSTHVCVELKIEYSCLVYATQFCGLYILVDVKSFIAT